MTENSEALTPIDIAYFVLELAGEPLTPVQIALAAQEIGYLITARQIQNEMEADIAVYGAYSPFIQVGEFGYFIQPPVEIRQPYRAPKWPLHLLVWVCAFSIILILWVMVQTGVIRPAQISVEKGQSSRFAATAVNPRMTAPDLPKGSSYEYMDWWQANSINQINADTFSVTQGLLSNPYNGCGPASLAMVINYHRTFDDILPQDPLTPAMILQDAHQELGYFKPPYNSGLLDVPNLRSIASLYGFVQSYPSSTSSLMTLEDLLSQLENGSPAIVLMRYHYQGDNKLYRPARRGRLNHFVVAIGTGELEGKPAIWLVNPHPGVYLTADSDAAPERILLDDFVASWMLNDSSELANYGYALFLSNEE